MKIRSRLCELNKTSLDVVAELHNRGVHAHPTEFSKAITGSRKTAKSEEILTETEKILEEWENERKNKRISR